MNETHNNEVSNHELGNRRFRPDFHFYHANAKGTGSAIKFALHPAHDDVDGSIFATIAAQKTVSSCIDGVRTFPTFDWENRITVKLDAMDLSRMLEVFRGVCESIADGKGLFHKNARGSTSIRLSHRIEPYAGYLLEVCRKQLTDENLQTIRILFTPTEALALALAIEQSMMIIAFGIPLVIPRTVPTPAPAPMATPSDAEDLVAVL